MNGLEKYSTAKNEETGKHRQNGWSIKRLAEKIGSDRFFFWQISHTSVLARRRKLLLKAAYAIVERIDKLEFFAGMNPWTHLSIEGQEMIWRFGTTVEFYEETVGQPMGLDTYERIIQAVKEDSCVESNVAGSDDEEDLGNG